MFVRRNFYRIIRRMKTFEKYIFHPSSKRNSFLGMIVTFDCSTDERENIQETGYGCSPATRRSRSNITSSKKRRFTGITAGKFFPLAFLSHRGMFMKCHVVFLSDQLCILFRIFFGYF